MLFQIASLIGLPLRLDAATVSMKRPSVARLQVEIDLLQSLPARIWIGFGASDGFWQKVEFENIPSYCRQCWHVGHDAQSCRVNTLDPQKPSGQQSAPGSERLKSVYVPVTKVQPTHEAQIPDSENFLDVAATKSGIKDAQLPGSQVLVGNEHAVSAGECGKFNEAFAVPPLDDQQTGSRVLQSAVGILSPDVGKTLTADATSGFVKDADHVIEEPPSAANEGLGLALNKDREVLGAPSGLPTVAKGTTVEELSLATPDQHQPPGVSSLVTYKSVLVDHGLAGVATQEIGFASTAIEESVLERALVVYQPEVPTTESILTSNTTAFRLPIEPTLPTPNPQHRVSAAFEDEMGYNDSDFYSETLGSDDFRHEDYENTDDHSYEDITDGSEGTHSKKKHDRRKLKGISKPLATKDELNAQSRLLEVRMRKRGRPPGSRNRTYFDVQRTMSTRATKSTSD